MPTSRRTADLKAPQLRQWGLLHAWEVPVLPTRWDSEIIIGGKWGPVGAARDNNQQPMALDTKTFELVIRPKVTDTTQPPLIKVTADTSGAQGYITVDTVAGTLAVTVYATATTLLTPGVWVYELWMNPGMTDATPLADGYLVARLPAAP